MVISCLFVLMAAAAAVSGRPSDGVESDSARLDQEPDDVNDVDENPWFVDDIKPRDLLAFGTYNVYECYKGCYKPGVARDHVRCGYASKLRGRSKGKKAIIHGQQRSTMSGKNIYYTFHNDCQFQCFQMYRGVVPYAEGQCREPVRPWPHDPWSKDLRLRTEFVDDIKHSDLLKFGTEAVYDCFKRCSARRDHVRCGYAYKLQLGGKEVHAPLGYRKSDLQRLREGNYGVYFTFRNDCQFNCFETYHGVTKENEGRCPGKDTRHVIYTEPTVATEPTTIATVIANHEDLFPLLRPGGV